MRQSELREIASFRALIGSWQFAGESGHHLAAVDQGDDETRQVRVFTLSGGRWRQVRQLPFAEPVAKAVDGYRVGPTVFVATELNSTFALRLWSTDYASLVGQSSDGALQPAGRLGLSPDEMSSVQVPAAQQWHAQLRIPAWLFSPRFVRGDAQRALVVASTADGQVTLLPSGSTAPERRLPSIRKAAEPHAVAIGDEIVVAFLRPAADGVYPFWLLQRYTPSAGVVIGDLIVKDGARPETNLSSALRLGAVAGLTMARGEDGGAWLFALVDVPVGTDVVALERRGGEWLVRARQTLDVELRGVSAELATGRWQMVYAATPTEDRTTLYSQEWQIAP